MPVNEPMQWGAGMQQVVWYDELTERVTKEKPKKKDRVKVVKRGKRFAIVLHSVTHKRDFVLEHVDVEEDAHEVKRRIQREINRRSFNEYYYGTFIPF